MKHLSPQAHPLLPFSPNKDRGKIEEESFEKAKKAKEGQVLSFKNVEINEKLGDGGSGCVVHSCQVDGWQCAMKVLSVDGVTSNQIAQFEKEGLFSCFFFCFVSVFASFTFFLFLSVIHWVISSSSFSGIPPPTPKFGQIPLPRANKRVYPLVHEVFFFLFFFSFL